MFGARTAQCPNCGGPIELALGSSSALVCPHCRYSIVRTDRDLRALGRVADLVPTAPPITVGDSGTIASKGFRVGGRLQLDHGHGPWDEWYVGFDEGGWGWLARAQGKWYLTHHADPAGVPPVSEVSPGRQFSLPSTGQALWTVQEAGWSTTLSGEGELPFPLWPGGQGRYADLAGPGGAFATVDYGDGTNPPQLFVGRELSTTELVVARTAGGPRPEETVAVGKLTCPSCGGPVEIRSAGAERAACGYCYSLLDFTQGNLQWLEKLEQPQIQPLIPLGAQGTLDKETLTVIGFMERYTVVTGITYTWREYLLYGAGGYRWLTEDNGHWALLRPISAGDIRAMGNRASYENRSHRRFSSNPATVRFVLGEFYWKVRVGEQTHVSDYIAPPHVLSEERGETEVVWSAGRYVQAKELEKAFSLPSSLPSSSGVGPAQKNPHAVLPAAVSFAALFVVFLILGATLDLGAPSRVLVDGPVALPPAPAVPGVTPDGSVDPAVYTPPFTVTNGPTTIEVRLETTADNQYVGVACALINEDTSEIREFYVSADYGHGVTGGESWTEGSRNSSVYVDRVPEGRYTLRLDPQWSNWPSPGPFSFTPTRGPPNVSVRVTQGKRSMWCCCLTFLLLIIPLPFVIFRRTAFEKRRWENSNLY